MTFYLTGQIPSGKNQVQVRGVWNPKTRKHRYHKYPNARFETWRARAMSQLMQQGIQRHTYTIPLGVEIAYTPGDRRVRDIPGMMDALWHVLQKVGFVDDDKQFRAVIWTEQPVSKTDAGVVMDFWKLPR